MVSRLRSGSIHSTSLSIPVHKGVSLLHQSSPHDSDENSKGHYEASLVENITDVNPHSGEVADAPAFISYTPSYNVTARIVYENFGTLEDVAGLACAKVSVNGTIAIVKQGVLFRNRMTLVAQQTGIVGMLMYLDPQWDGEITE